MGIVFTLCGLWNSTICAASIVSRRLGGRVAAIVVDILERACVAEEDTLQGVPSGVLDY